MAKQKRDRKQEWRGRKSDKNITSGANATISLTHHSFIENKRGGHKKRSCDNDTQKKHGVVADIFIYLIKA